MSSPVSSPVEYSPTVTPWPSITMYPTASGSPTQSPYPTSLAGPSSVATPTEQSMEGRLAGTPTYVPTRTAFPSLTYFPTASELPTSLPSEISRASGGSVSTQYPTPLVASKPSFRPSASVMPTGSYLPTVTSIPSSSSFPTSTAQPSSSFMPSVTSFPTASQSPQSIPSPTGKPDADPPTTFAPEHSNTSKYGYNKVCSGFVNGPLQVDTELVFTYLAESSLSSVNFVTELEIQLLDHASATALECSDSSTLKIYRLAYPADESSSDATTCAMTHPGSKSCWVLQTRIYVTSDRDTANLAKFTVLTDIQQQLNNENMVTTSFRDLTFSQYLGPDPVNLSGTPVSIPSGVSSGGGSDVLERAAKTTVALAIVAILAFVGLAFYVRRKRREAAVAHETQGYGGDLNGKDEDSMEVAELLSRSKARLREHPVQAETVDLNDSGDISLTDDVEAFHDEVPSRSNRYDDSLGDMDRSGKSESGRRDDEHRRVSSSQGHTQDKRVLSSPRSDSQRSVPSTYSKNQTTKPTSHRQRDDSSRNSTSSRRDLSPRKEGSSKSTTSRPTESRREPSSRDSRGRRDEESQRSPHRQIPQSVEIDFLDGPYVPSVTTRDEPTHASHRQPRESSSSSNRPISERREGLHRSASERVDGSRRAPSDRTEGSRRAPSDRGEGSRRAPSDRAEGSRKSSTSERGDDHSRRSTDSRKSTSLYDDPVELAKERMAVARSDAESRRRRRSQSSTGSRLESKFDNVEIV